MLWQVQSRNVHSINLVICVDAARNNKVMACAIVAWHVSFFLQKKYNNLIGYLRGNVNQCVNLFVSPMHKLFVDHYLC